MMIFQIHQIINQTSDDKLSELDKYRAREIELNIKYGYDRKATEDNESKSTSKAEELPPEDFENEEANAISPTVQKDADPMRVEAEELELQYKNQNNSQIRDRSHFYLILSGASDYLDMIYFIYYYQNCGGFYSLIPYIFFVIFLSFPVSVYEAALAQFSSLPIFSMFNQMAPIIGGVPHLMLYGRCVYIINVAFRPKMYTFMYSLIYTVLTGDDKWMHCTNMETFPCYDPSLRCDINEVQVFGVCEPRVDMNTAFEKTAAGMDQYARVHNLEYFGMAGTQITSIIKDFDTSDLMTSTFLCFVLMGFAFHTGYRGVSKLARVIITLPIIGILPISLTVWKISDGSIFRTILMKEDSSQMMSATTLSLAILEAYRTTQIGQGTLFTLGSKAAFSNNYFKDMVLNTLFGVGYRLFYLLALLPVYYYCQWLVYPDKLDAIDFNSGRRQLLELLYDGIPLFMNERMELMWVAFFFATINLAIFSKNVVTFEIVRSCTYKFLPRLSYSNNKTVGLLLCVLFVSVLMLHERFDIKMDSILSDFDNSKYVLNASMIASLFMSSMYTMIGVRNVYGDKRLYINCLTMLRKHTICYRIFFYLRDYFLWTWALAPFVVFFPFVVCTIYTLTIYDSFSIYYVFVVAFPIVYSFWIGFRTYLLGGNVGRLGNSYLFRPVHWKNEREAEVAEKGFWNLE